jgi:hypothetical protein
VVYVVRYLNTVCSSFVNECDGSEKKIEMMGKGDVNIEVRTVLKRIKALSRLQNIKK